MKLLPDTLTIMQKFIQTRVKDAAAGGVVLGLSGALIQQLHYLWQFQHWVRKM